MMDLTTLLAQNAAYLEQGAALLDRLDDAAYTRTQPPYYTSSIGAHLRHTLEHYVSFLRGLDAAHVDYDARDRDLQIENSRTYACGVTRRLAQALDACAPTDRSVRVKLDGDAAHADDDPLSQSTLKRELQYLMAHTIHHYALIAMILRLQGLEPGEDFGVAPSTLRYRHRLRPAS